MSFGKEDVCCPPCRGIDRGIHNCGCSLESHYAADVDRNVRFAVSLIQALECRQQSDGEMCRAWFPQVDCFEANDFVPMPPW